MNQEIMSVKYLNLWWDCKNEENIHLFLFIKTEENLAETGLIILGLDLFQDFFFLPFVFVERIWFFEAQNP